MTLPALDFETYSEAGFVWDAQAGGAAAGKWAALPGAPQGKKGLQVVGAAVYATHPTADVLCAVYDLQDGHGPQLWTPDMDRPDRLLLHVQAGGLLEAWNSGFEHWIWNHVCVTRYGWPPLPQGQLRCAMARARAHALPGSLASAGKVVGAEQQKNPEGKHPAEPDGEGRADADIAGHVRRGRPRALQLLPSGRGRGNRRERPLPGD